jgi:hypothetical protein
MNGGQRKVAGWTGIAFVALFVAGIVLSGSSPDLNASTAQITLYYQNHHGGIVAGESAITLASAVFLWFLGGLYVLIRQRDEHGLLAPVVLASGVATVALGMVGDVAGTVAGLLAGEHSLGDPTFTRAMYELSTGVHLAFFPLAVLTATVGVAIFQGALGGRWLGYLSALTSVLCLMTAALGGVSTSNNIPPIGLLGLFVLSIALSVNMLRGRAPVPLVGAPTPS